MTAGVPVTLAFVGGTIELRGLDARAEALTETLAWDPRAACWRAPAVDYANVVRALRQRDMTYDDGAAGYPTIGRAAVHREPRPYQERALTAWSAAKGRGVVVLPTGAGKSHVAVMAIDAKQRAALVVAPTLDLVRQWYDLLRRTFDVPVGVVGGGDHDVLPLTVTTYDSAHLHMASFGARFGLVVFDECHHLPADAYALAARSCLAPFRLGLTATLERADGREADLRELVGPTVYREEIGELAGDWLAEYDTVRITAHLTAAERAEYDDERALYRGFLARQGIRMSTPGGWNDFIIRSSRSDEGARAMKAYRRQREIAFSASAKLDYVEQLLGEHCADRTLVFTDDNATAYRVSRRFLVPAITHQTKVKERSVILERFSAGDYGAVVTSRVLNEGVDVPDANVAIVMSGTGSVREHVQRLGRILRPKDGKRALLYELVTAGTGETYTSERRREHDAYR